jgi:hypothetical protein
MTQHHVLGDREMRDQRALLVGGGNPGGYRRPRGGERDVLTVDRHRALVGAERAGQDPDGRRLATAVLAQQRVDGPGVEIDAHPVERGDRVEPAGHTTQGGDRLRRHCAGDEGC